MKRTLLMVLAVLAMASVVGASVLADLDKAKVDHATKITKINADLAACIAKAKADREVADTELVMAYDKAIAKSRDPDNKTRLSEERDSLEGLSCVLIPNIKRIAKVKGPLKSGMQLGPYKGKQHEANQQALPFIRMRKAGMFDGLVPRKADLQGNAAATHSWFWFYLRSPRDQTIKLKVTGVKKTTVWLDNDLVSSNGSVTMTKGWHVLIVLVGDGATYDVQVAIGAQAAIATAAF